MLFRSELSCLWKFHWYPFSRLMQLPVFWARGEHRGSLHSLSRPGTSSTKQASLKSGFWELSRCLLFYSCTLSLAESSAFIGSLCLAFWYFEMCKGCSHFVWRVHGGKHLHRGHLYNRSNCEWHWRRFGWLFQIHKHSSEGQVESLSYQALACAWHKWQHLLYS